MKERGKIPIVKLRIAGKIPLVASILPGYRGFISQSFGELRRSLTGLFFAVETGGSIEAARADLLPFYLFLYFHP